MSKSIYKYPLTSDYQKLNFPKDFKILSAINQHEQFVVYVLVNADEPATEEVEFFILGTGWERDDEEMLGLTFLNTVSTNGGNLVWHIFYKE